ncbi:hypothetical protein B5807_04558 [Epicoccum nigrum]|uniref:Uncharacterized protein n=1 Tax=Epicoccum nigrum TaxID=105696 RepID=A0A1Y2M6L9_EPING|nr:hypothetical protein B5807_04558 [Epicoccum nigrum]
MSEDSNIAASYQDEAIIKDLASLLDQSAYACGGAVAVKAHTQASEKGVTSPVTIRWDSTDQIEKIVLPTTDPSLVQRLIKSTQLASFGLKGEDVIDESYRKASKLDPYAFSTTFCPYEVGIIDILGQTLLPLPQTKSQGIRAEFYKLNRYMRVLLDFSNLTLIPLAQTFTLGPWSFVSLPPMSEDSFSYATRAIQPPSTG